MLMDSYFVAVEHTLKTNLLMAFNLPDFPWENSFWTKILSAVAMFGYIMLIYCERFMVIDKSRAKSALPEIISPTIPVQLFLLASNLPYRPSELT